MADVGKLAALHHERLDGSGYHRGASAAALPVSARVLAAADTYQALREPRPYRAAFEHEAAERELHDAVRAGHLDGAAVSAVLQAATGATRARRRVWPAGLTDREIEVVQLVAHGLSNRQIGHALSVSPRTAGNHVQHIYDKLGLSTRAAVTLFASQHDLLGERGQLQK